MKKEVGIAIVLGILAGLIITFGIYTANTAMNRRIQQSTTTPTPAPQPQEQSEPKTLILFNPEDNSLTDKDHLQISGTSAHNAVVVIFVNETETIANADEKGNFSAEVELTGGSNVITVVATDGLGNQEQEQRTVVFSTANLEETPNSTISAVKASPSPSPKQTPGGSQ
ncbi:MAG TPA: Ig-like domain-containing protein [Patescibacteria group bacterium]|nr:Ig-like domain-containing protein [Patescibacteria group bacterium]